MQLMAQKDLIYSKSLLAGVEGSADDVVTIGGASGGDVNTVYGYPAQDDIGDRVNLPTDIEVVNSGTDITRFEHLKAQDPTLCVVIYTLAVSANDPAIVTLETDGC